MTKKKLKNRKIESTTFFFCYVCVNLIDFLKFDFDKHVSIMIDHQF